MRIALVDEKGELSSVAWVLQRQGTEVSYWTKEENYRKVGMGLVDRVDKFTDLLDPLPEAALVYNLPDEAQKLKKEKVPVVGPTRLSMLLEFDRQFAVSIARQFGVGVVPETVHFTTLEQLVSFIKRDGHRRRWVFKTDGGETTSTHVTEDTDHLLVVAEYEASQSKGLTYVLQEFIAGLPISVEGWFDYRREDPWLKPINSTLERKHLFSDGVGPMVGCMGSVVWTWKQERPRLFRATIEKMTSWLKKAEYVGPLDGNFVLDYKQHRPHFLEFTPRLGWNAFEVFMHHMYDLGKFINDLARGSLEKVPDIGMSIAVRLYVPAKEDMPIRASIDEEQRLLPKDVWRDEEDQLRTVGNESLPGFSVILEAVASSSTVERAALEVYEDVIPQVVATDLGYRKDIGKQAEEEIELLQQWGFVVEPDRAKMEVPVK